MDGNANPGIPPERLVSTNRRLPHWQQGGSVYFITFRCRRGCLPPAARALVIRTLAHDDGAYYTLLAAVVMPDHVHALICPCQRADGSYHNLSIILKRVKGVSAHCINVALGTNGRVWQAGWHDRLVRDERELLAVWDYIANNPVKAGLVCQPETYEFTVHRRE